MIVTIPEFRNPESIAKRLRLTVSEVLDALNFLERINLVVKEKNKYLAKSTALHLEKDSPLISQLHSNWRLQALQSLTRETPYDVHYSGVFTCAKSDLSKLREKVANCVQECTKLVSKSNEEEIAVLTADFYLL